MTQENYISRRGMLTAAGMGAAAVGMAPLAAQGAAGGVEPKPFSYCLNTGTIRGQKLPLEKAVEAVAKAGYNGIEPWIGEIADCEKRGGSLKDLKKKIADLGLTVESGIGFANWIVDDDDRRAKGLEQFKRDMDLLAQIGGIRIAAPPAGANREAGLDLFKASERYRAILDIGDETGVTPQVEIWGSSKNLSRIGESMFVVLESGHPKACLLPDVYHIYKGGSDFHGLKRLSASTIQVFHMNDYPADPPRDRIGDADRVYPGDGIAPLTQILRDLQANGGGQALSLELFNRTYWQQDVNDVLKTGLAKMKAAVAKALG